MTVPESNSRALKRWCGHLAQDGDAWHVRGKQVCDACYSSGNVPPVTFPRAIRLGDDRPGSRWWILPTRELRELVLRNRLRVGGAVNYVMMWKDTNGYGIHLAHADWVGEGGCYISR